jgi:predicted AAA+ superfamily ATPase
MLTKLLLKHIYDQQQEVIGIDNELDRTSAISLLPPKTAFARIITGVRRCGKSTLLRQILKKTYPRGFLFNFDDPRLVGFTVADFELLDELIEDEHATALFFDEIQLIPHWELYIKQKLDAKVPVYLTGSNAALLSQELGTMLTGRHLDTVLYPFSYKEYCSFMKAEIGLQSFSSFLQDGGFPVYLQFKDPQILTALFSDIIYRDIVTRYNLKQAKHLKLLAIFLLSNVGSQVSANRLVSVAQVKTAKTILEYFSYLEVTYLFAFVYKFDYSLRAQINAPRKVYAIDTALIQNLSANVTLDQGHIMENAVYLE